MSFLGLSGDFYKRLVGLTLPAALQLFLFNLLTLTDNWMVAGLGTVSLTGVSLSNKFTVLLDIVFFGLANGITVYTSQAYSIKDYKGIHQAAAYLMVRAFFISLIIFLACFFFTPQILGVLTKDKEVIDVASRFLPIMAISYIPMCLSIPIAWLARSFGDFKASLYATAVAVLVNLGFNYYFIYILGWGVVGAATGTVIARCVELSILLLETQLKSNLKECLAFSKLIKGFFSISTEFKNKLFKLVLPITTNEFFWILALLILELIYLSVDRVQYSSFVIANGAAESSYFIFHALAISCGITLGGYAKEGKEVVRKMGDSLIKLAILLAIVNAIIVFSLSFVVPSFFPNLDDPSLIGIFLRTIAIFTFFSLISLMMNIAILRSGGDGFFALVTDIIPQWCISLPCAFILANYFGASVRQIYMLVASVEACKLIVYTLRIRSGKWIKDIAKMEENSKTGAH